MIWVILMVGVMGGVLAVANMWIYKNTFVDRPSNSPWQGLPYYKKFRDNLGVDNSGPDSERD